MEPVNTLLRETYGGSRVGQSTLLLSVHSFLFLVIALFQQHRQILIVLTTQARFHPKISFSELQCPRLRIVINQSTELVKRCFTMSVVSLLGVKVLNNPAAFGDPYKFEITFECLEQLQKGWSISYSSLPKSHFD